MPRAPCIALTGKAWQRGSFFTIMGGMALLQLSKGSGPAEELTLHGDRSVLGRHPDCDIVLDAASVSRQHAQIILQNGQYYVEDLHSRNGTFVNGRLIQGRHPLVDGDRLKICDLALAFYTNVPSDRVSPTIDITSSSLAMLVNDPLPTTRSTIVSKLGVTTGSGGRAADRQSRGQVAR